MSSSADTHTDGGSVAATPGGQESLPPKVSTDISPLYLLSRLGDL
jgi:hypothetical protein